MSTRTGAGYSGTPLAKKLGLVAGLRITLHGEPDDYAAMIDFDLDSCRVLKRVGAFDFGHAFVRSRAELAVALDTLSPHLEDRGMLWISWPKKASRIVTDLTEDSVRELALPLGLVDVKVCAIDAIWSGLKLVRRVELRAGKR
ncbi:MAG: DUF3052 domain-containing protein [Rhodanobacteraceae bacterium]|nr:DUF3052 domain-containing protein [Rhodanobacteraceae bacterium]